MLRTSLKMIKSLILITILIGIGCSGANSESGPPTDVHLSVADMSVYPIEVDPDQDNVPNVPITGHPEIHVDNCPTTFNPDQADSLGDGIGDACRNLEASH